MTPQQRADALQARLDPDRIYFSFFVDVHGAVSCMTEGRLGIMSDYWMRPNTEQQSAAFSIGTDTDDYAAFLENETAHATKDLYGLRVGVFTQNSARNIAIQAIAHNSTAQPAGNIPLELDGQGIAVADDTLSLRVGPMKIGSQGPYRQIWPVFE